MPATDRGISNNVWTNDASGLKQGFEHFEELWRSHASRGATIAQDDTAFDMGAAKTNERILEFVDSVKGGQPFFVFVNYFEPHLPYRPTRPFDDDFLPAGTPASEVTRLRSFFSPREYSYILGLPTARVDAGALEVMTTLYDGELACTSIDGRQTGRGSARAQAARQHRARHHCRSR